MIVNKIKSILRNKANIIYIVIIIANISYGTMNYKRIKFKCIIFRAFSST